MWCAPVTACVPILALYEAVSGVRSAFASVGEVTLKVVLVDSPGARVRTTPAPATVQPCGAASLSSVPSSGSFPVLVKLTVTSEGCPAPIS